MALDRQSIEKKDFPLGRRGYDPDAVDAHLAAVAAEVEELRHTARRRSETLASAASEQVRAIVEAAESSAGQITQEAEDEARALREEADNEARATREHASEQAREYVSKVSESTNAMLQRLDAMESEVATLIETLREGGNRINADLQLLEGDLASVSDTLVSRPRFEAEPLGEGESPNGAAAPGAGSVPGEFGVGSGEAGSGEPALSGEAAELDQVAADTAMTETVEAPEANVSTGEGEELAEGDLYVPPGSDLSDYGYGAPSQPSAPSGEPGHAGADDSDDTEGARLIALNMALNGTPREETERYLSENFRLADAHGLLDEVYASVEG